MADETRTESPATALGLLTLSLVGMTVLAAVGGLVEITTITSVATVVYGGTFLRIR